MGVVSPGGYIVGVVSECIDVTVGIRDWKLYRWSGGVVTPVYVSFTWVVLKP